jgi:hypothetical protein
MDNLTDINHEIIDIICDKNDVTSKFNLYVKETIPKKHKSKIINNKITYNESNSKITIQIHEHDDTPKEIFSEFVDDSDSDHNENISISSNNIGDSIIKINAIVNESMKETTTITDNYNKVMDLYKHLNGTKTKGKSLVLKF